MKNKLGFTLVELAIILLILGLLLAGILAPLSSKITQREIQEEKEKLEEIKEALIGFALVNRRLPCPDTNANGLENSPCTGAGLSGDLPRRELGVNPVDTWGRLYRYRVSEVFTETTSTGTPCVTTDTVLGLCDEGDIDIDTRDNNKTKLDIADKLPAVVVSFGPNGSSGTDIYGNTISAPIGADELENSNNNVTFFIRNHINQNGISTCSDTSAASDFCDFDDQLIWISPKILFNRMIQASHLP